MKTSLYILMLSVLIHSGMAQPQGNAYPQHYEIGVYTQYDLQNSSNNAIALQRLLHNTYRSHLGPKMQGKVGKASSELLAFTTTYLTLLWSHEFGHSLRAKQVGGHFKIHNVALPIPYTTMHLPDSINLVDEALSVTAGFEVNSMNVRGIQRDFLRNNGATNEDLAFAFANRIMYPLYASVIVPIDPEDPVVWEDTAGDPVHTTLPVFRNYSNDQIIMEDGSVNPDLVSYYSETAMLSSLFNFLDPQFYVELGANFGKKDKERKPHFLLGDHRTGWTYGTLFSVSPLGYELYMHNYIHVDDKQFTVYLKYGKPYKNQGLGVAWRDFYTASKVHASASIDVWDQDIFGRGFASDISLKVNLKQGLGLVINTGYKSKGYVLGKTVDSGFSAGMGLDVNLF